MTQVKPLFTASRMTAEQYEAKTGATEALGAAKTTAQKLIDDARETAKSVLSNAKDEAQSLVRSAKATAEQEANAVLEQTKAKNEAVAFAELSQISRAIQDDYENLERWIGELVATAVTRIVGSIEETEQFKRLLQTALQDTKRRWQLELRVHPSDYGFVQKLCQDHQAELSAISDVVSDDAVKAGGLLISSEAGLTDVSLDTQIAELKRFLDQSMQVAAT